MADRHANITFHSEDDTRRFAVALGAQMRPGDVVLLDGDIGTGKTYLARALIHSLQDTPEDVPSPTFTLVQTYDTRLGEVWHTDLYRIGTTDEIEELGLLDAFQSAICLVEWPDRLGDFVPTGALSIRLSSHDTDQDRRDATLSWQAATWDHRVPFLSVDTNG